MKLRHLIAAACLAGGSYSAGATVLEPTIVDTTPGQGHYDVTGVTPAGGNAAVFRGQARLNAELRAALLIDRYIGFSVPLWMELEATGQGGTANAAPLAAASPSYMVGGFAGAAPNRAYPIALANDLTGSRFGTGLTDLQVTMNTDIDGSTVLGSVTWYYGFDTQTGNNLSLVETLLHEIMHGLGFLTVLQSDGTLPTAILPTGTTEDHFMPFLEYHGVGTMPALSANDRATAFTSGNLLHWTGAAVRALAGSLTAGKTGDHVHMYAPNPYEPGSSVSHFDTSLAPDALMEPFATANSQGCLGMALMRDIGWRTDGTDNGIFAHTDLALSMAVLAGGNTATPDLEARITNNSTVAARLTYLTASLPVGTTATSASHTCRQNGQLLRCQVGTVQPGATINVQLTLTNAFGTALNGPIRFNVSGPYAERTPADNTQDITPSTAAVTQPALGGSAAASLPDQLACGTGSTSGGGTTTTTTSSGGGGGAFGPGFLALLAVLAAFVRRRGLPAAALALAVLFAAGCGGNRATTSADAGAAGERKAVIDPETGRLVSPSRDPAADPEEKSDTARQKNDESSETLGEPTRREDGSWYAPVKKPVY